MPDNSAVSPSVQFLLEEAGLPPLGRGKPRSPGRIRIESALVTLLAQKAFCLVTTGEIAKTAGVTEALIYKYFKNKQDLLHQVLARYLRRYHARLRRDLMGMEGGVNKLKKLIEFQVHVFAANRVFAKIMLLEVRPHPDYYESETHELVRIYWDVLREIFREAEAEKEIRADLAPEILGRMIQGAIEQSCMPGLVCEKGIQPDVIFGTICSVLLKGIETREHRPAG